MSGLPYQGGLNSYMFDTTQYGVGSSPMQSGGVGSKLLQFLGSGIGSLATGGVGSLIGAGLNLGSQFLLSHWQNKQQEEMYNKYSSPAARMQQMVAAGINPNAAAQGISGAAAPQMNAATPGSGSAPGLSTSLADLFGNSANTMLGAELLKSQIKNVNADTGLKESTDIGKQIENKYADSMQKATLDKLVQEGKISKSFANMAAVDEAYKPATAYASYQQLQANLVETFTRIDKMSAEIEHEYAMVYESMMSAQLSAAQIRKVFSDIGVNNAMIDKISHEIGKIDAETAATYQGIDESKARQALLDIQKKFQDDYYGIWQSTGFNWNSDIDKSIVGAFSNMQTYEAERMLKGLSTYISSTGTARVGGDDYKFDKYMDIFKTLSNLGLGAGVAAGRR